MNVNNINYEDLIQLMSEVDNLIKRGNINVVTINSQKLVMYHDGTIYRLKSSGNHKLIPNIVNTNDGYNRVSCNGKVIRRHRIIAHSFLNLDINNVKSVVDHKDNNKLNNHINNLRVVTQQQNLFNISSTKGYYWSKNVNKYIAIINLNKSVHLGLFSTKEEAREAYLKAKLIYHII